MQNTCFISFCSAILFAFAFVPAVCSATSLCVQWSRRPSVDMPQVGDVAYHVENAGHLFGDYDWEQFLLFFDKYLKTK